MKSKMTSVLGFIKRSLSGESVLTSPTSLPTTPITTSSTNSNDSHAASVLLPTRKTPRKVKKKRHRSNEVSLLNGNEQKKSRLQRSSNVMGSGSDSDGDDDDPEFMEGGNQSEGDIKLPEETPEWGNRLLAIIQGEFKKMIKQISKVER